MSKYIKISFLLVLMAFSQLLSAENLPSTEMLKEQSLVKTKLLTEPNRLIVAVDGMCCQSCEGSIGKNVAALANVDTKSLPKGIKVDTKNGLLTVAVLKGQKVKFASLFEAIRKAGYEPVRLYQLNSDNSLAVTTI